MPTRGGGGGGGGCYHDGHACWAPVTHGFGTVQSTIWGQVGGSFATQQQLEWMAANYGLVIVGPQVVVDNGTQQWPPPWRLGHGLPGQFENARRFKAANHSFWTTTASNWARWRGRRDYRSEPGVVPQG